MITINESPQYQHLTNLPEALERALIGVPMKALLAELGWSGAITKYTAIIALSKQRTEAFLSKYTEQQLKELKQDLAEVEKNWDKTQAEFEQANAEKAKREAAAKREQARKEQAASAARKSMKGKDVTPKPDQLSGRTRAKRDFTGKANPKAEANGLPKASAKGIEDKTVVHAAEGRTKLSQGSARRALMEHLKVLGGKATVKQLTEKLGTPAKPVVAKLLEVGWVTVNGNGNGKGKK